MKRLTVDTVKCDGGWLLIKTNCAERICSELKPGKKYDVEITEHREKRSLDANSLAWKLINEIANVLGSSKEEIYEALLKSYGQCGVVSVEKRFAEDFKRTYKYHESLGESVLNGKTFEHFKFWVGSSQYNTREMSIFIDGVMSEAKDLGIETLSEEELSRLE